MIILLRNITASMLNISFPNNFVLIDTIDPKDIWDNLLRSPLVIIRSKEVRTGDREWAFKFINSLGTMGADELHVPLSKYEPKLHMTPMDIYAMDNKDDLFKANGKYIGVWHQDMTCMPKPTRFSIIMNQSVEGTPHPMTEFRNLAATYKYSQYKEEAKDVQYTHFNTNIHTIKNPTSEDYEKLSHDHPLVQSFFGKMHYCYNPTMINQQQDQKVRELMHHIEIEANNPMFAYKHRYEKGDILIWNQLMTNHRVILNDNHKHRVNWRSSFTDDKLGEYYASR